MISTTVCRVARRGVVLRSLQPASFKLSKPTFTAAGVTRLQSPSTNNPAIRHFTTSTCVFVAKKATKAAATKPKKRATSAPAKKTAVKKTVKKADKKTTKKVAAKKKTTARRNVAAKKATPKKKVLTPEQKERLQTRKQRQMLKEKREEKKQLLETGLVGKEPKNLPTTGWMVFLGEKFKAEPKAKIAEDVSKWAAEFKLIPDTELERYKAAASQNSEKNKATYEAWVNSHAAITTYQANEARRRLGRYFDKKIKLIHDARIPKKPAGPFMEYMKSRPQGNSSTITESAAAGGKEWKSMTDAQKQPYVDMWTKDKQRYISEMKAIGVNFDA